MKRVLIIAYYLNDENMGAIRLRRIATYLNRMGYEPVVLTSLPRSTVVDSIPGARIERVKALDLKAVYERVKGRGKETEVAQPEQGRLPKSKNTKLTAWLNRWLMIPDKQIPWYRPAVKHGRRLMKAGEFDLIFASLEPRTNLLVAANLAKFSGLPCVMEYRDLWNNNPYHHQQQPTFLHKYVHRKLEQFALSRATKLSTVCKGIQEDLREVCPADIDDIGLVYNFYDSNEYPAVNERGQAKAPFTVIYTGAMYFSRHPGAFFKGFRKFLDRNRLSPKDVRFRWMGVTVAIPELEELLEDLKLADYIDFEGIVDHETAIRALCDSDVALILQSPEDTIHIPGKLYEAFGARVPVLTLANECETTSLIDEVNGGIHVHHNPDLVCGALQQFWCRYIKGQTWRYAEKELEKYSAENMVERLGALFEGIRL